MQALLLIVNERKSRFGEASLKTKSFFYWVGLAVSLSVLDIVKKLDVFD